MKYRLTMNLLIIILSLILIVIYIHIDGRQFMIEGFSSNNDNENGSKLVLFHADWCGHCKKMKPDWDKVKSEFPNRCQDIESEQITQEHRDKYDIKGFPSIFTVNKDNQIKEWDGGRTYTDFKNYLNNN